MLAPNADLEKAHKALIHTEECLAKTGPQASFADDGDDEDTNRSKVTPKSQNERAATEKREQAEMNATAVATANAIINAMGTHNKTNPPPAMLPNMGHQWNTRQRVRWRYLCS